MSGLHVRGARLKPRPVQATTSGRGVSRAPVPDGTLAR
jgi:hypothetical protein